MDVEVRDEEGVLGRSGGMDESRRVDPGLTSSMSTCWTRMEIALIAAMRQTFSPRFITIRFHPEQLRRPLSVHGSRGSAKTH